VADYPSLAKPDLAKYKREAETYEEEGRAKARHFLYECVF